MSTKEVYIAIAIAVAITFFIRMFPLFFFSNRDTIPKIVKDLGVLLPYSMMAFNYLLSQVHALRFPSRLRPPDRGESRDGGKLSVEAQIHSLHCPGHGGLHVFNSASVRRIIS